MTSSPRALIAEDEPLLAQALQQMLAQQWPALQIQCVAADGISAASQALALQPDVLFLDIRMPGQSGLEAAAEITDSWPDQLPLPAIVFVTAYDQYALAAFDACAMDYVLKPVQGPRLQQTVRRLQSWWARRQQEAHVPISAADTAHSLQTQLAQLLALQQQLQTTQAAPLQIIQASVGSQIHMVRVQDIIYLEAADKYLRVLTASQEYLIRTSMPGSSGRSTAALWCVPTPLPACSAMTPPGCGCNCANALKNWLSAASTLPASGRCELATGPSHHSRSRPAWHPSAPL